MPRSFDNLSEFRAGRTLSKEEAMAVNQLAAQHRVLMEVQCQIVDPKILESIRWDSLKDYFEAKGWSVEPSANSYSLVARSPDLTRTVNLPSEKLEPGSVYRSLVFQALDAIETSQNRQLKIFADLMDMQTAKKKGK